MQLVIDIDEDVYEEIMVHNRELRKSGKSAYYLEGLIQNGTPLPEGHGRLIDADAFIDTLGISDRDIYAKECIEEYILTQS